MSQKSNIEWTDASWNPITGCSKISKGCENCYAERLAHRLKLMGNPKYKNGFDLSVHDELIELPLKWKHPRMIFVNSMSDLFHEKLPFEIIAKIFATMNRSSWHTFQILTKRARRMYEIASKLLWTKNIWAGVTIESSDYIDRLEMLTNVPAFVKFISFEPLLSEIPTLDLQHVDWVIAGGESGPNARPVQEKWITNLRDLCIENHTPFFFKQWGGINKKKTGRVLEGRTWDQMPVAV